MFTSFFHPLTTFPTLLSFGIIAPLVLRVSLAAFLLYLASKRSKREYGWSSAFYVLSAILLILGFYTQITAIASIALLKLDFYLDYYAQKKSLPISWEIYFLYAFAGMIALSLIMTGPGLFARDLPL